MRIEITNRLGEGCAKQLAIHFTRRCGVYLRRMSGGNGKMYLSAVIWFPRSNGYLGYKYPSIRWF